MFRRTERKNHWLMVLSLSFMLMKIQNRLLILLRSILKLKQTEFFMKLQKTCGQNSIYQKKVNPISCSKVQLSADQVGQ
jgi:hypothetical protein